MKRVFSNSNELIHLFAQQSQSAANCGNVFFSQDGGGRRKGMDFGNVCYSYGYHYELGRFLDKDTIMINDDGYSNTTSKHIGKMMSGTSQYKQFFKSGTDVLTVLNSVKNNWEKLQRANKPEIYIGNIIGLCDSLNEFLTWNRTLSKHKRGQDAEHIQYRAIQKILKKVIALRDGDDMKERLKTLKVQQKATKERQQKQQLKKFFAYEVHSMRGGDEDFLRLSEDQTRVETTQGVKVPIEEAAILYKLIKAGKDIKGHFIGGSTVIAINGTLKIGCHNINRANMKMIGEKICTLV